MIKSILAVFGLMFGVNAFATGGFSCEYNHDGINFALNGVTSHSFEGDIVSADGRLQAEVGGRSQNVDTSFTKSDIRQYWNYESTFNIILYTEKENGNGLDWVRASILTTENEKESGAFVGTLTLYSGTWAQEKLPITCYVE